MTCSTPTLKIFAILWDVIYALLAAVVLSIGIYIVYEFDHFNKSAYSTIAFGLVVLLAAFLGIATAVKENSRWLKCFAVIVIILAFLQVVMVGFFWVFQTLILANVNSTFDQLWGEQILPIRPENGSHIASIERWFNCCGNTGSSDYKLPPYSCYNSNTGKLNENGCRQTLLDYISDCWIAFNIFAGILVLIELFCAVFAYVLANSILNRWRRSKYYPK